jgi:hypothetical protein
LGREGRVKLKFLRFLLLHHQNHADFAEVISRGVGNRKILIESMLLFYGKAIVETENWLSQSMHFFSKESIDSLFRKTEGTVHDRDIAGRKLSRFPVFSALHQSANPLHQITN